MKHFLLVAVTLAGCQAAPPPPPGPSAPAPPARAADLPPAPAAAPAAREIPLEVLADKVRGCWLGQFAGAATGAPLAFRPGAGVFPGALQPLTAPRLAAALDADDLALDAAFLRALRDHSPDLTPLDAGRAFLAASFPAGRAAARARDLLRRGVLPPWTGHPVHNGDFTDNGFAAGAEVLGLAAPGLPRAARALSRRFGPILSHGDGLDAGTFVAAMISEALLLGDPGEVRRAVDAGLRAVPAEGACAKLIREVLAAADGASASALARALADRSAGHLKALPQGDPVIEGWQAIEAAARGPLPLCCDAEARVNLAQVVLALVAGNGDPAATLDLAARFGRDAEGNASTAGGVLGAILGGRRFTAALPPDAAPPAGPIAGSDWSLDDACAATVEAARNVAVRNGAVIENRGGRAVLVIPAAAADAPDPALDVAEARALYEAERRRVHDLRVGPAGVPLGWQTHGDLPLIAPRESLPGADGAPAARIEVELNVTESSAGRLTAYLLRRPGYGRVRFTFDGRAAGAPLDLAGPDPLVLAHELGAQRLPPGRHVLRIDSLDGRAFGIFAVDLTPPPPRKLTRWRLSPAFSAPGGDAFDAVFPPEEAAEDPSRAEGWTDAKAAPDGMIDLLAQRPPGRPGAVYAATVLSAREAFDTQFLAGSDDGLKLWVNGRLVHANHQHRLAIPQNDVIPIRFEKGPNRLLLKIEQGEGDWKFILEVEDPGGKLAP